MGIEDQMLTTKQVLKNKIKGMKLAYSSIKAWGLFGYLRYKKNERKKNNQKSSIALSLAINKMKLNANKDIAQSKIISALSSIFDFSFNNFQTSAFVKNAYAPIVSDSGFSLNQAPIFEMIATKDNLKSRGNSTFFGFGDQSSSVATAMGGANNPSFNIGSQISAFSNTFLNSPAYMGMTYLTTLYQTNSIAFRLANLMVQLFTSKWVNFYIEPDEASSSSKSVKQNKEVIDRLNKFIEINYIKQIFARFTLQMFIHGGVALYIETTDADESEPIDKRMLSTNFTAFKIVDIALLVPVGFQSVFNFASNNFNMPDLWQIIYPNGKKSSPTHRTRFIFGVPQDLPFYAKMNQLWYGTSIFVPIHDDLMNIDMGFKSVGQQVQQASVTILQQDYMDYSQTLNEEAQAALMQNKNSGFQQMVSGPSISQNGNATVISKDDVISRLEVSNMKDQIAVIIAQVNKVFAAFGINLVKAWGNPLEGFSSGDSELEMSYESTAYSQEIFLRKPLNELFSIIQWYLFPNEMRAITDDEDFFPSRQKRYINDKDVSLVKWDFNPIYNKSEIEKQQEFVTFMQGIEVAMNAGLPREIVIKKVARSGMFPDMDISKSQEYTDDFFKKVKDGLIAGGKTDHLESKDLKGERGKGSKPSERRQEK